MLGPVLVLGIQVLSFRNFGIVCVGWIGVRLESSSLWRVVPPWRGLQCRAVQESHQLPPSRLLSTGQRKNLDLLAWGQLG